MNKKGESQDLLKGNLVYLILLVIFFVVMLYFVLNEQEGADIWADYYAKEIVKVVDFSKARDGICLDVHKATEIAQENEVESFSEIFQADNIENEVCVKLSRGVKRCFKYFNNVDVVNLDLKLIGGKNEEEERVNVLCFDINEARKNEVRR